MPDRPMLLSGEQIRAARAFGRLEQAGLARMAGVSLETIKRLERIRGPVDANSQTLIAIVEACRAIGIAFESGPDVASVRMTLPVSLARRSTLAA